MTRAYRVWRRAYKPGCLAATCAPTKLAIARALQPSALARSTNDSASDAPRRKVMMERQCSSV
jgi:hypothetical protein